MEKAFSHFLPCQSLMRYHLNVNSKTNTYIFKKDVTNTSALIPVNNKVFKIILKKKKKHHQQTFKPNSSLHI